MTFAAGSRLGRYEIRAKLGEGGMGEVYLAEDTKLDRKVALKILPDVFAGEKVQMSRFVREAKSVSALNHPNILTIYEIGEDDGRHYMATEFIDGETLRRRMELGPLSMGESIEIARQVGAALKAAHQAGIIHRDIKPENVMVRADGLVKVLDFGLAKLTGGLTGASESETCIQSETLPGMIMGTVAYMSPQQARGLALDARTDVWSLGVVIYEMLAGSKPFKGETMTDTLANIIYREPEPLKIGALPDEFKQIVGRMLAKDLDKRYHTIKDVVADLKNLQKRLEFKAELERTSSSDRDEAKTQVFKAPTTADELPIFTPSARPAVSPTSRHTVGLEFSSPSIAVLPFANISNDADNDYFCDGLAEELLNALSKIEALRVAARTSAFSFKGKEGDIREIGTKLNVSAVLEGSVRKAGNRLRITAQLVNVADGYHLWSERYDRQMEDIFDIQDEISLSIVDALKVRLLGDEKEKVLKRYTESSEAHRLYLMGLYFTSRGTKEGAQKGIEHFHQAIELDPGYALAFAGLADSYCWLSHLYAEPKAVLEKARAAARTALELDERLAEAHVALGLVKLWYDWDWPEVEREFQRAIELNPSHAEAHYWYAFYLTAMKRFDEGRTEVKHALALDPLSLVIQSMAGWCLYFARRYDEAIAQFRQSLDLEPNFFISYWGLGWTYIQQGHYQAAITELNRALALSGGGTEILAALGHAYARMGETREARQWLDQLKQLAGQRYVSPFYQALVYVGLGEREQACAALHEACDDRFEWLTQCRVDPVWDTLHSEPRFQELLRRIGLPH
jgi:eukaryotic-like serine/threonine-protein kinase